MSRDSMLVLGGRGVMRRVPGVVAALAVLVLLNLMLTPHFGEIEVRDGRLYGAVIDILRNGAVVALLAVGMTLVIGAGGIDLSVGSVMAMGATAAALGLSGWGLPAWAAVLLGLGMGGAAGLVSGVLVNGLGLQPIVATLVVMVVGRGLAQWVTGEQKVTFDSAGFEWLGTGSVLGVPAPVVIAGLVTGAVWAALRWTVLGVCTAAIGENAGAARRCGLPVRTLRTATYVASGLCAALAGMIGAADIRVADVSNAGLYLELDAILAVVIGGTPLTGGRARLVGSVIGALFMQTLTVSLYMRGVAPEHALVVKGVVALVACAAQAGWRPRGQAVSNSPVAPRLGGLWAGVVLLVLVCAVAAVRYSGQHFFTGRVFLDLLDAQAVLGIIAVGMTLVIISGGIDLAVGAVMAVASVAVGVLIEAGWPAWAAIGVAVLGAATFGAFQGAVIQWTGLGAFIVTLAGMFVARGLGFMLRMESVAISDSGHAALSALRIRIGEAGEHGTLRMGAVVMLAVVAAGAFAARHLRFGRLVFALGGSEEGTRLMGLPVARTRVGVYALSGMCAGIAGVVLTLQTSSGNLGEGVGRELDAIAAVVIGGTLLTGGWGSVLGTLVGTLIIGVVMAATTYEGTLGSGATRVVIGGLLLGFVVLQKGLMRWWTVRR